MQQKCRVLVRRIFEKKGELYVEFKALLTAAIDSTIEYHEVDINRQNGGVLTYICVVFEDTIFNVRKNFPDGQVLDPKDQIYKWVVHIAELDRKLASMPKKTQAQLAIEEKQLLKLGVLV